VGVGCLQVLMEWVVWMQRVALSSAATEVRPSGTCQIGSLLYSQNRDEWCGLGEGGSEMWLHARVLGGCEARCEVLAEHGAGRSEHGNKHSRRCRAPIVGVTAASQLVLDASCFVSLIRYSGIITFLGFPRVNRPQIITWGGRILSLHHDYVFCFM